MAIFSKVLGLELSNSFSADICLSCRVIFTSNSAGTEALDFAHLELPTVNTSDELNPFGTPATIVRRPADGSYWSVPGHVFVEVTTVRIRGTRSYQNYSSGTDF